MKLSSVMIGTERPEVLGEFYTKIFGKPGWQQDKWYGFLIGDASLMVGPHSEVHGRNQSPGRVMFNIEVDDIGKEFTRIRDLGAEVVAVPYTPSEAGDSDSRLATLADPDGNYFQLATPWKQ